MLKLITTALIISTAVLFIPSGYCQEKKSKKIVQRTSPSYNALRPHIDSIFSSFNNSTPGVALMIVENGSVIFRKAVGKASLEHNIPFTHNTVVRLPYSEGREFISIASVLMEQRGLLSLDDKVKKYFPELPAWSEPVTIHDLLNHRSGFADEWATLLLTQASMANRFDKSQFLNFLYRQPKPEVPPGIGYMYSNSDFGLLRLILERAAGENLQRWMKKNLFDPLQMKSTLLDDDKNLVIPGYAQQYYQYMGGYKRWTSDKTSPGGNYYIATTVNDLEKWAAAHADPSSIIAKAIVRLFENPQLMPGNDKNYVFGYKIKKLGNYEIFTHQGVSNRTYISSTKDKKITVILLSNATGETYPYHESILSYLLDIKKPPFKNKLFIKEKIEYTLAKLQQYTGSYVEEDTVTYESFTKKRTHFFDLLVINDSLKMKYGNAVFPLDYIAPGVFKDVEYPAYLEFLKGNNNKVLAHIHQANKIHYLEKDTATRWQPSEAQLRSFTGKYYSPHLDFYWTIVSEENGKLLMKRATIADTPLEPASNGSFRFQIEKFEEDGFISNIKFHTDEKGKVTHLTVYDSRLMHHRFDKVQ